MFALGGFIFIFIDKIGYEMLALVGNLKQWIY